MNTVTISARELEVLCLSAFRYAVGRKSYVCGIVAQTLLNNASNLEEGIKGLICSEIKRLDESYGLGMAHDKAKWLQVLEAFS